MECEGVTTALLRMFIHLSIWALVHTRISFCAALQPVLYGF